MNLRRLLLTNETIAVVSVVVVVMIGLGVRLQKDKEVIDIALELFAKDRPLSQAPWSIERATVTYDGPNKRTVHGDFWDRNGEMVHWDHDLEIILEKRCGKWTIAETSRKQYESLWDRIKGYVTSLLVTVKRLLFP